MATLEAWTDRETILSLFKGLKQSLDNFKIFAEALETFKVDVLDDPARKAELLKLIDEDPNCTLQDIQEKYNEYKTIYDYLEE